MIDFYALHRHAFCQFLFRCFYYNCSNESTIKETWKTHFCALVQHLRKLTFKVDYSLLEGWKSNMISHNTYPPSQSFVKFLFKCFPYFFTISKLLGYVISKKWIHQMYNWRYTLFQNFSNKLYSRTPEEMNETLSTFSEITK